MPLLFLSTVPSSRSNSDAEVCPSYSRTIASVRRCRRRGGERTRLPVPPAVATAAAAPASLVAPSARSICCCSSASSSCLRICAASDAVNQSESKRRESKFEQHAPRRQPGWIFGASNGDDGDVCGSAKFACGMRWTAAMHIPAMLLASLSMSIARDRFAARALRPPLSRGVAARAPAAWRCLAPCRGRLPLPAFCAAVCKVLVAL
jgi:hypothetical protein